MIRRGLQIILRAPCFAVALIGSVLALVGTGLCALAEWWDDTLRPLSSGYCERHGHRMGEWWMGWRWCERCPHAEPMRHE